MTVGLSLGHILFAEEAQRYASNYRDQRYQ